MAWLEHPVCRVTHHPSRVQGPLQGHQPCLVFFKALTKASFLIAWHAVLSVVQCTVSFQHLLLGHRPHSNG